MATGGSRPYRSPRRSPHQNFLFIDTVEDEFARDPGPVGSPHSGNTFFATSCNHTPGLDQVPALIPAPAPTPTPAPALINELFKKFMKAYLESNQGPRQPPAERKRSLKAKILEVYYGKLHMNCYHFC